MASWADERGPVTGDAVELVLPPGMLGIRVVSGAIDLFCIVAWNVIGLIAVAYIANHIADWNSARTATAMVLISVFALVVWPTAFETLSGGKSPGKYALGLRTVRLDGGPISFQHALTRALFALPEIQMFSGIPALVSAAISPRHQRMGDRLAGTMVVQDRARWTPPAPPVMPPHLETWAAGADIEAVPEIWIHWAHDVTRRPDMYPAARAQAIADVLRRIAPWVTPPPPPASDADLLEAILAERFRRSIARDEAKATLRRRLVGSDA